MSTGTPIPTQWTCCRRCRYVVMAGVGRGVIEDCLRQEHGRVHRHVRGNVCALVRVPACALSRPGCPYIPCWSTPKPSSTNSIYRKFSRSVSTQLHGDMRVRGHRMHEQHAAACSSSSRKPARTACTTRRVCAHIGDQRTHTCTAGCTAHMHSTHHMHALHTPHAPCAESTCPCGRREHAKASQQHDTANMARNCACTTHTPCGHAPHVLRSCGTCASAPGASASC